MDSLSERHILVDMQHMGLQNILVYIDMLLPHSFFGTLHLTHMEMDYMDLYVQ